MKNTPKVSVIIPCYNCIPFIEIAINSVIAQTEQSFEILIGDDCSTDGTLELVQRISTQDNRIKHFINAQNSGPSATRNRLINEAQGEWIALLDADDFYQPERLEKLIEIAEIHKVDLVADNLINVDMQGQSLGYAIPSDLNNKPIEITAGLLIKKDLPGRTAFKYGFLKPIIRRQFLVAHNIRYQEAITIGEDFFLYLECLIKSAIFLLTLEPFYGYRIRPDSLTRSPDHSTMPQLMNNNRALIDMALEHKQINMVKLLQQREQLYGYCVKYVAFARLIRARRLIEAIKLVSALPLSALLFFVKLMSNRLVIKWINK